MVAFRQSGAAARNKQATLSRHILETELRLEMVLFDRKTRGATLTPDGGTHLRRATRCSTVGNGTVMIQGKNRRPNRNTSNSKHYVPCRY
jgi:hypothetical protein